MMALKLEEKLKATLAPQFIEVHDESHMHSRGLETHFKVVLVSDVFLGKNKVARHQVVHAALKEEIPQIHALSLSLHTPEEWQKSGKVIPSPQCAK